MQCLFQTLNTGRAFCLYYKEAKYNISKNKKFYFRHTQSLRIWVSSLNIPKSKKSHKLEYTKVKKPQKLEPAKYPASTNPRKLEHAKYAKASSAKITLITKNFGPKNFGHFIFGHLNFGRKSGKFRTISDK